MYRGKTVRLDQDIDNISQNITDFIDDEQGPDDEL